MVGADQTGGELGRADWNTFI